MNSREEAVREAVEQRLDDIRHELQQKERELLKMNDVVRANESKLKVLYEDLIVKLEQLSGMSRDKAKETLLKTLEAEVVHGAEKWIQKAIKKPGALRSALGAKKGEPIPAKKLAAAAKKPGKMGQRARLAQTLKGLKK